MPELEMSLETTSPLHTLLITAESLDVDAMATISSWDFFFFFWLTKAARFTPYSYNGRRWPNFSYPTYRTLSRVSPKKVAPDSDIRFQAKFWDTIHAVLGTQLLKSSVNRPESDGQAERTIRTVTGLIEFSQTMTHKIGLSSFLC